MCQIFGREFRWLARRDKSWAGGRVGGSCASSSAATTRLAAGTTSVAPCTVPSARPSPTLIRCYTSAISDARWRASRSRSTSSLIDGSTLPPSRNCAIRATTVIWVLDPKCAVPITIALRQSIIEVAAARQEGEGQHTKMGMVYQYLTGPRFRTRIEAIVEKFTDMQDDLDRERKAMTRLWGDLQGIAGNGLHEIEGLELVMLPGGDERH